MILGDSLEGRKMKNANQTLYDLIGVSADASQAEIENACLQLGEKCQPGKNSGDLRAALMFAQIEKAYQTLADPVKRAGGQFGQSGRVLISMASLLRSSLIKVAAPAGQGFPVFAPSG
jgi:curved DNA-binding protein CbpA